MEQIGYVRKIVDDKAEVEVKRISGCGGGVAVAVVGPVMYLV